MLEAKDIDTNDRPRKLKGGFSLGGQNVDYATWIAMIDREDREEMDADRSSKNDGVTQAQFDDFQKLFEQSPYANLGKLTYNSKNGHIIYEGSLSAADYGKVSKIDLTERMQLVLKTLKDEGVTGYRAHAFIGNLLGEDALLNPNSVGDGGAAFGIAQWHRARREPSKGQSFKDLYGYDMTDRTVDVNKKLVDEVKFALRELRTTEKGPGNRFFNAANMGEAVAAMVAFERPADQMGAYATRMANARGVAAKVPAELKVDAAESSPAPSASVKPKEQADLAAKPAPTPNSPG